MDGPQILARYPQLTYTMSLHYFPPIKPSALAVGTIFSHFASFIGAAPVIGDTIRRAKAADTPEEFARQKENIGVVSLYGSSLLGAGLQSYAVSALIVLTGTTTNKGAAYLGALIFAVNSVPALVTGIFQENRPVEYLVGKTISTLLETVGLTLTLNWWGTRNETLSLAK